MEEIREIFDLWDKDGSGEIDVRGLRPIMVALAGGKKPEMITKAAIIKMLTDVSGTDGTDGTIDFGQFVEMITSKVGNMSYGDVVARLSSRTVIMGCQAVGQSTNHYKARMKKASVTQPNMSMHADLAEDLDSVREQYADAVPIAGHVYDRRTQQVREQYGDLLEEWKRMKRMLEDYDEEPDNLCIEDIEDIEDAADEAAALAEEMEGVRESGQYEAAALAEEFRDCTQYIDLLKNKAKGYKHLVEAKYKHLAGKFVLMKKWLVRKGVDKAEVNTCKRIFELWELGQEHDLILPDTLAGLRSGIQKIKI